MLTKKDTNNCSLEFIKCFLLGHSQDELPGCTYNCCQAFNLRHLDSHACFVPVPHVFEIYAAHILAKVRPSCHAAKYPRICYQVHLMQMSGLLIDTLQRIRNLKFRCETGLDKDFNVYGTHIFDCD